MVRQNVIIQSTSTAYPDASMSTESDVSKMPASQNYENVSKDLNTSIEEVRDHLKNVIDMMGPHSPKLNTAFETSNDADNEESLYSSTSIISSSVLKVQKLTSRLHDENSEKPGNGILSSKTTNINEYEMHKGYCSSSKCVPPKYLDRYTRKPVCCCVSDYCPCHSCPYNHRMQHQSINGNEAVDQTKVLNRKNFRKHPEFYRIEMEQSNKPDINPPKRFVFDLVDNIPHPMSENGIQNNVCESNVQIAADGKKGTPWSCPPCFSKKKNPRPKKYDHKKHPEKIDIYYFDHGNSAYFRTTDSAPLTYTDELAQKTEMMTTKFWAEIFGSLHIFCAFVTAFILQFLKFTLYSIIRPLTIGIIQLTSDYFIKPFLAVLFNGILQPPLILFYNIATSIKDLCHPIAIGFGYFLIELAKVFSAIRFVEIRNREPRKLNLGADYA
ncbi:uncharacterized protein LOC123298442 [Chrysoperla carnea]|uniref:uncharacterized protein LOC123298442 n=1 Tax=Chrysoperla carnea TaxID=189513 RepID=UPI001D06D226|nr:uncharacterized protein LOC123298442 [Chrysoperla carnea]